MSRALFHRLAALCPLLLACLTGALADQSQHEGGGGEKKAAEKDSDQKSAKQKSDQTPAEEILRGIRAIATEEWLKNAAPAEIEKWLEGELRNKESQVYEICYSSGKDADPKRFGDSALFFLIAEEAQMAFEKISGSKETQQKLKDAEAFRQKLKDAALDMLILTTLHEKMEEPKAKDSLLGTEELAKLLYCRGCCAAWWSQEVENETEKKGWGDFAQASFREAAEKGLLEALYSLGVCQEIEKRGGSGVETDGYGADDYYAVSVYLCLARAYLLETVKPDKALAKQKSDRACVVDQSNRICESVGFVCKADPGRQKVSAGDIKEMLSGDSSFLVPKGEKWWQEGTKDGEHWRWRDLARDCIRGMGDDVEIVE